MIIADLTLRALQASLHGLNLRRRAAEENIANVETPGYRAGQVSFEASLRRAIQSGDPSAAIPVVSRSLAPTRSNGNNVAIDSEIVGLTETGLRHQLVVEAMNAKYRLLRAAIEG